MRVLVVTEPTANAADWAEQLRELDHTPLMVSADDVVSQDWFASLRSAASRADIILMGSGVNERPYYFEWLLGYAEALGTQVILVSGWRGGVLDINPRNIHYNSFQDAVDMYFSTGRAMTGERALP